MFITDKVFLGMAASSVPVRKDVPNTKEDLDAAGVRFVYFSAQNMKRSKPVAGKIGIPFDWNCAISLRELQDGAQEDPHRHISNYADWDVLGKFALIVNNNYMLFMVIIILHQLQLVLATNTHA